MEIILAIVVASAVIFFGALISIGNERQRKAIDILREQIMLWAMQDLRIKREKLALSTKIDDPLAWLSKVAGRIVGYNLNLQFVEFFCDPQALVCTCKDKSITIIFSSLSPNDIRQMRHKRQNRLSQYAEINPLLSLKPRTTKIEINVLNSDIMFELELPIVWKELTGYGIEQMEYLWMYIPS